MVLAVSPAATRPVTTASPRPTLVLAVDPPRPPAITGAADALLEKFPDVALPGWLQSCLLSHALPHADRTDRSDAGSATEDQALIARAFQFAYELHQGQMRKSGDPYIAHPIAVAGLLRDLGCSPTTIAAGFLHDVVEDTDLTHPEMEARFGPEVRFLVEGVTKLSRIECSSKTEQQAETFRRMFLAMGQDIRVIVVKLADRLHNMRTLEFMPPDKQRRIAQETLDIFAPLANRLGIGRFKWELEDLSFKYLQPAAFAEIRDLVADKRADREAKLDQTIRNLHQRLQRIGIERAQISGRPKHLYSIYQKMQRQNKSFWEIYDIAAIRIILQTSDECYRALAVVHEECRPIPGRFKDYIGLPKPNRYQSLHTSVIGTTGRPLEVQIRSEEMHRVAEYGIAAHWKYKETGASTLAVSPDDEKFAWLRQVLDCQSDFTDASEFLENIKTNLYDDEVFVFTPQGDVIALPAEATPVDFAYRIHTEVGNHCAGALVNRKMVPLGTPLQNGDIVEIIKQKNARPSLDWMNFTVTATARNRIRQWFKRSHRDENIARGRALLEKDMGKASFDSFYKSELMQATAERCNYHSPEDVLAAIGYGEITLNAFTGRMRDVLRVNEPAPEPVLPTVAVGSRTATRQAGLVGLSGLMHHVAGCCRPVPGEAIVGAVTQGHGIAVHRQGCPNLERVGGERLIPVAWNAGECAAGCTYPVEICVEAIDRVGILKDILIRLSDARVNVNGAEVQTRRGETATIKLGIDICDRSQLDRVFAHIRKMSDVIDLRRLSQVSD